MVPDRPAGVPNDGEAAVDSFALYDTPHSLSNGYLNGVDHSPHNSPQLSPKTAVTEQLSPKSIDLKSPPKDVISNGVFWPPLKAIPLTSFYKLHRIPSPPTMDETQQNGVHEIPRSETSSAEPLNGVHNKLLEQVIRTPGRQPSPQPTHLSVPGPAQPKVLHEQGSGYVAPKFEGKESQMDQGMRPRQNGHLDFPKLISTC